VTAPYVVSAGAQVRALDSKLAVRRNIVLLLPSTYARLTAIPLRDDFCSLNSKRTIPPPPVFFAARAGIPFHPVDRGRHLSVIFRASDRSSASRFEVALSLQPAVAGRRKSLKCPMCRQVRTSSETRSPSTFRRIPAESCRLSRVSLPYDQTRRRSADDSGVE